MIQHQFFSYQKTNGESSRKMEAITHDMRSIFGTTSWIDNNHEDLLRKKIAHKLGRIRGAMRDRGELVDSRDGLVYQPSGASAMSDTLSAFENAARQLAPTEASQALYCLRGIFGSSWILEEVITWDPDCSGKISKKQSGFVLSLTGCEDTGATGDLVAAQSAAGA